MTRLKVMNFGVFPSVTALLLGIMTAGRNPASVSALTLSSCAALARSLPLCASASSFVKDAQYSSPPQLTVVRRQTTLLLMCGQKVNSSLTATSPRPRHFPHTGILPSHILTRKVNTVQYWEKTHSHNFITIYCYTYSILLLVTVVNFLRCLI